LIIQPFNSFAALTWAGAAAGSAARSWSVGTVLDARQLGVSPEGMAVLQIGETAVEVEIGEQQRLPAQFQVRVLAGGPKPQLEILSAGVSAAQQRGLRALLPQQNGYAPLLATLGALAQRPQLRQLPPELRAALAMLDQTLSTPAEVTRGEGLREAIRHSGLFLEAHLAQAGGQPAALAQADWKAALLRLAGLLDQRMPEPPAPNAGSTPPPLLHRDLTAQARLPLPLPALDGGVEPLLTRLRGDVKAALARLAVAQLGAGQPSSPAWMIEIPLQGRDGRDVLQLQLEYVADGQGQEARRRGWNLGFALALPALGAVRGELQLHEPHLSVRLWAEHADTAARLEAQFGALRQRLGACGLLLDQLSCQVGLPESAAPQTLGLLQATA